MGNKVINLGTKVSQGNLEVYRDVSMISDKVNGNFKISKDVNVKAVFNSLHNIFTWMPGENILFPDFGSRLRKMLYEQITDYNVEQIMAEIRGVVLKYEPRVNIIKVVNVSDINDTENNTVRLDIIFTIPSLGNEQYNYSYIYKRTDD